MVKVREEPLLEKRQNWPPEIQLKTIQQQAQLKETKQLNKAYQLLQSLKPNNTDNQVLLLQVVAGFQIAHILAELHLDQTTLTAGLLYRSVRKNFISLLTVQQQFGEEVRQLVQGVLDMVAVSQHQITSSPFPRHNQAENLRKMLVAIIDDVRVALIKIAERIAMLRLIKHHDQKSQRIAREVFDIYAPLVHRLGIGQLKWELEDLSFRYLQPIEYKKIAYQLAEKRTHRDRYIEKIKAILIELLALHEIDPCEVDGRAKHIYSIWRKMQRKQINFEQVYDMHAVRILVTEISDCYKVLSLIQERWPFLDAEFDDYIVHPKENGYQSLHTAVLGPENKIIEIQIRTFAMQEAAELGVCAHWRYKGMDLRTHNQGYEQKISWMREVLAWQNEIKTKKNQDELKEETLTQQNSHLQNDERIYVFTPANHVLDLPKSATPLDFAYNIHTDIGHRCRGAKINGRIASLQTSLKTGDQVEVLTVKEGHPSRDWLNPHLGYIKTTRARAKIANWFKQHARIEHIENGKTLVDKELARYNLLLTDRLILAHKFNYQTVEDFYVALGCGNLRLAQVIHQIQQLTTNYSDPLPFSRLSSVPLKKKNYQYGITLLGVDNLKMQLANCCHPLPGDSIIGFITHGHGVSIHQQTCRNIKSLSMRFPNRLIEAQWLQNYHQQYHAGINIRAHNRPQLLQLISEIFSQAKIAVTEVKQRTEKHQQFIQLRIDLTVSTTEKLFSLIQQLRKQTDIIDVERIS